MIESGTSGLLVPAGDAAALAAAMSALIADQALRERLGREAKARAEMFTAAAVVPRFEALYARLIAAHARRRATGDVERRGAAGRSRSSVQAARIWRAAGRWSRSG
jgi:hypothetical protein